MHARRSLVDACRPAGRDLLHGAGYIGARGAGWMDRRSARAARPPRATGAEFRARSSTPALLVANLGKSGSRLLRRRRRRRR